MTSKETKLATKCLYEFISDNGPLDWYDSFKCIRGLLDHDADTIDSGDNSFLITSESINVSKTDSNLSFELNSDDSQELDSGFLQENYMSPEHLLEAELDERSHIYSIGCILFETISGRPPFKQKKAKKVAENQIAFDPPKLSNSAGLAELPQEVENIVQKCIEKDPEDRYQSLDELQEALVRADKIKSDQIERKKEEEAKEVPVDSKPLIVSGSIMLILTIIIVVTIQVTSSKEFAAYIVNSKTKKYNQYFLTIENGSYLGQMEFEGGKSKPKGDKVPITIRQVKSGKILFATTKRKSVKEAVEEAIRRQLYLPNADFRGADLRGVNMQNAYLAASVFEGADLRGANFSQSKLVNVDFKMANLNNAILDGAKLEFSDFRGANLKGASLKYAFLPECNLVGATLEGADLEGADLASCKVDQANFSKAKLLDTRTGNIVWSKSNLKEEQYKLTARGQMGWTIKRETKETLDKRK